MKITDNITINDKNLVVDSWLGSSVISRNEIEEIVAVGNLFWGIVNCILFWNIVIGIKMLAGKKRVLIKKKYEKEMIVIGYLTPEEVSLLRSNI
jgi:hypothetical protein